VLFAANCRDAGESVIPGLEPRLHISSKLRDHLPITKTLNIIVVSFDAMRPDVLAPHGGSRAATPNIADFADRSVVFENAYSVAPVTPTSFAAFFSGMLPTRVFHAWSFETESTLASELSKAGCLTAAFINNVQLAPERGFDSGFDVYEWRRNHLDGDFIQDVFAWIEENRDRRFFVWIHFLTPHAPYNEVPDAHHLYTEKEFGRFAETTGNTFHTTDEHEIARIRDLYLGEVWTADQLFGELIDHVQQLGLLQSSIVLLTSDHGEEFGEHGGFQHGRLYEEHLRVPLILYHPQGTPGRIEDLIVRSIDLVPTLLHLAGRPLGRDFDGQDLLERSSHEAPPVVGISMTGAEERWISILDASHKLIVACGPERQVELYDLEMDPLERHDIAAQNSELVAQLFHMLGVQLGGAPCEMMERAVEGSDQTVGLDAESVEALRALGYID
jgi:arylsulfatase A-like enzyme